MSLREGHVYWLGGFVFGAVLGYLAWWAAVGYFVISVVCAFACARADRRRARVVSEYPTGSAPG